MPTDNWPIVKVYNSTTHARSLARTEDETAKVTSTPDSHRQVYTRAEHSVKPFFFLLTLLFILSYFPCLICRRIPQLFRLHNSLTWGHFQVQNEANIKPSKKKKKQKSTTGKKREVVKTPRGRHTNVYSRKAWSSVFSAIVANSSPK